MEVQKDTPGFNDKIALCMICKGTGDEPAKLRQALESIHKFVDGIFITLTGPKEELVEVEKVCSDFKAHVSYERALLTVDEKTVQWLKDFLGYEPHMKVGDQVFLFDKARNFNFAQVPEDYAWFLWMDTDDIFMGGENLWKLKTIGVQANVEAFYLRYVYQAILSDETICQACQQKISQGKKKIKQIIIEHLRERLVRNNGAFKWIAPIHETLIEQRPTRKTDNEDCFVLHTATQEDFAKSLRRNLNSLELAIYQTEGKDPRHIYYLAKAYYDLKTIEWFDKAIPLINLYLYGEHKSGWPEERAQACEYLAEMYRQKNELNNAIKACMNALIEAPENPSIYINLAICYIFKQDWDRALYWIRTSAHIPEKKTTLVKSPRELQGMALEVIYNASIQKGMIDEAWAAANKMMEIAPDVPQTKEIYQFISSLREQRDVTNHVAQLSSYLKSTGEWTKLKPLLAAVPAIAKDTPFVQDLEMKNLPPTPWGENELAIYCGPGFTTWSGSSLANPGSSFVGGSEEAVILMSEELAKLGWKVTVFGDPGQDEGEYKGVRWLPYYKFNLRDSFNILIVWRQLGFFDQEIKAKKVYLWNHDIQNPLEWTPERYNKITKAMFLSKWHRDNVPALPEEKVFLTSNGI